MDATVQNALIGGASGLITGAIVSLVAPWANWSIEKRKQKLASRREMVNNWREMVKTINLAHETEQKTDLEKKKGFALVDELEQHSAYYSLKPRLTEKLREEIDSKRYTIFIRQGTNSLLLEILDEIAKIEEKWLFRNCRKLHNILLSQIPKSLKPSRSSQMR